MSAAELSAHHLAQENEELRQQLREAQELVAAVREGAVDGLLTPDATGSRFLTREGADHSYRTLVEQMSEGAALLDLSGLLLYANAALGQLLAVSPSHLLGGELTRFVPAEYQAYWTKLVQQAATSPVRAELPLLPLGGSPQHCAVSMNALVINEGPAIALLVTDLSVRRQLHSMQAQVAAQTTRLHRQNEEIAEQRQSATDAWRILEGIPPIAWTTDARGRNLFINSRWADFIGHEPTEAERQLDQFIHPDDRPRALSQWARSRTTEQPMATELRARNAQGDYRWLLVQARPLHDAQGQLLQWIGTYTDIEEQKQAQARIEQAERQLRDKNDQLTRLNVDLDTFVYAASHDLKQPVSNIDGLLHALLDELPFERSRPVQDILRLLLNSVNRFQRTIDQLTDISRLQRQHLVAEPIGVADIVRGVALDLAPQLASADAELILDLDHCPPVLCSEKSLRGIAFNLLSNAIKYRDPTRPPRIEVRAYAAADKMVAISVQDNGLGMDTHGRQKLFGMFERLHSHVEGSGIGLFMVKKMVENVGGRVEVESAVGVGSTFVVYLPSLAIRC